MANSSEGRFWTTTYIAGLMLLFRAVLFFSVEISLMYGYAQSDTINLYSVAFFCSYLYFAYSTIVALRLLGVYLGSSTGKFFIKQNRLTYLSPNESALKNRSGDDIDVEKLKQSTSPVRYIFPTQKLLSARTVAILLFIDLILVIFLEFSIPGLPRLYFILFIEFLVFVRAILESIRTSREKISDKKPE